MMSASNGGYAARKSSPWKISREVAGWASTAVQPRPRPAKPPEVVDVALRICIVIVEILIVGRLGVDGRAAEASQRLPCHGIGRRLRSLPPIRQCCHVKTGGLLLGRSILPLGHRDASIGRYGFLEHRVDGSTRLIIFVAASYTVSWSRTFLQRSHGASLEILLLHHRETIQALPQTWGRGIALIDGQLSFDAGGWGRGIALIDGQLSFDAGGWGRGITLIDGQLSFDAGGWRRDIEALSELLGCLGCIPAAADGVHAILGLATFVDSFPVAKPVLLFQLPDEWRPEPVGSRDRHGRRQPEQCQERVVGTKIPELGAQLLRGAGRADAAAAGGNAGASLAATGLGDALRVRGDDVAHQVRQPLHAFEGGERKLYKSALRPSRVDFQDKKGRPSRLAPLTTRRGAALRRARSSASCCSGCSSGAAAKTACWAASAAPSSSSSKPAIFL